MIYFQGLYSAGQGIYGAIGLLYARINPVLLRFVETMIDNRDPNNATNPATSALVTAALITSARKEEREAAKSARKEERAAIKSARKEERTAIKSAREEETSAATPRPLLPPSGPGPIFLSRGK